MTATEPLFEVDAAARLSLSIDRLTDHVRGLRPLPPMQPVFYNPGDQCVIASTVGLVDLGGPDMGHWWSVRSIVVGGVTVGTAAAGVADVFVSGSELGGVTGVDSPPLTAWRDRALTLPQIAFYGVDELVVRASEHLIVRFSGATNAQQYIAQARVTDYQEAASPQASIR